MYNIHTSALLDIRSLFLFDFTTMRDLPEVENALANLAIVPPPAAPPPIPQFRIAVTIDPAASAGFDKTAICAIDSDGNLLVCKEEDTGIRSQQESLVTGVITDLLNNGHPAEVITVYIEANFSWFDAWKLGQCLQPLGVQVYSPGGRVGKFNTYADHTEFEWQFFHQRLGQVDPNVLSKYQERCIGWARVVLGL
jgi:hypothetical protein